MERTEIGALLVKEEANYGVDSAPTGTNVIPAIGDSLGWSIDSEQVKRRPLYDHSDPMPGLNVLPNVTLKFGWEVRVSIRAPRDHAGRLRPSLPVELQGLSSLFPPTCH